MRMLFDAIDEDRSGHIDKEEFISALHKSKRVQHFVHESQMLRSLVARKDFDTAFRKMDRDAEGGITFDEFWRFCEQEADKRNIKQLFRAIDKDGSKRITVDELKWAFTNSEEVKSFVRKSHVLAPLIHHAEDGEEDWNAAFAAIDADSTGDDGHGEIDIHEFFDFCKRMASRDHIARLKRMGERQKVADEQKKKKMQLDRIGQYVAHIAKGEGMGGSYTVSVCISSRR